MSTTVERPSGGIRELTIRAVVVGGIITLVFTAANVYLGLKVGLTFATSIPAAVISMAVLRKFRTHTVIENNIVQTIASAAGTLSAIIFVLPGLVMIGWWSGFPYWETAAICAIGGTLGVMYSIPLRRALVTGSDLPYPEGVAAAEVLKVGDTSRGAEAQRSGLRAILTGATGAAGFSLLGALKMASTEVSTVIRMGTGGTMIGTSLSLALVGVGHLVGLSVGFAMIVGVAISFGVLLPVFSRGAAAPLADFVSSVFSTDVRFVGAGAIAVAAIWTLLKIIGPIFGGIKQAAVSARRRRSGAEVDVTERDIPITVVGIVVLASLIPIGMLLYGFIRGTILDGSAGGIITASLIFILVIGLIVASVCGDMAGLIGASNSPISGVGILVAIAAAVLLRATYGQTDANHGAALIAYTLFTAAVVFSVGTISNDNLQDLKTGQLVGATPWKQQAALIIGVIFVDEILGQATSSWHLPPLAVGMGMYLSITLTVMIPIGAVIGWFYDRWAEHRSGDVGHVKRAGILLATGLIVGESLFGVLLAGIVAATGKSDPLAVVGSGFDSWANIIGVVVCAGIVAGSYWSAGRRSAQEALILTGKSKTPTH